jgi:hypothetical protein
LIGDGLMMPVNEAHAAKILTRHNGGLVVLFTFVWPPEAMAIRGVLIVREAVASALLRHRDRPAMICDQPQQIISAIRCHCLGGWRSRRICNDARPVCWRRRDGASRTTLVVISH